MDYNKVEDLISGFDKILKLDSVGSVLPIPSPVIFIGVPKKQGLSPTKIASRIISRKSEAGLPIGNLPSGNTSPDEIMWRIAVEEIVKALQEDAVISVSIPPGLTLTASGISPAGPVTVFGATITFGSGYATIQ
jgi:hypothetical protein